jgi:hypothetical protein
LSGLTSGLCINKNEINFAEEIMGKYLQSIDDKFSIMVIHILYTHTYTMDHIDHYNKDRSKKTSQNAVEINQQDSNVYLNHILSKQKHFSLFFIFKKALCLYVLIICLSIYKPLSMALFVCFIIK